MDMGKFATERLVRAHPGLNSALFPIQSKSLMYCAIPKIASKTLISLIMYVYVRDIIDIINNSTKMDMYELRTQQIINIPKLLEQLKKKGIVMADPYHPVSAVSLLQTFLHILRFEKLNETSPSLFFNPWSISVKDVFPGITFRNLLNLSSVFSSSFTRFLFVRHPFERLASAYKERIATLPRDRIEPEPHYDNVRKTICRRLTRFGVNRRLSPRLDPCENSIPTFQHFVEYVLSTGETPAKLNRMDAHWQPYTTICQVCKFKYNFIGKYETFNDDLVSLLKQLNIPDWNIQKRRGASGQTTNYYQQLYSSLPDHIICRLKNLYNDDLNLFNYRIEDYVNRTTLNCRPESIITKLFGRG
ncbi:unnamed protein product [Adineta steineri]|uniref:Carbohydrate sulfotransferase n=1 Tax=Adineta steineri TaxID=433720 RepID=A0A814TGD9_9BILA|nr:unnamed protein product [Adineta steineri]CAF1161028.1 unnamed protein product [Adineta steineri]